METLEHFLFYCNKVSTFWNELNILLKSQKIISKNFHIQDFLFGLFSADNVDDNILVNYILESKYLIFSFEIKPNVSHYCCVNIKMQNNAPDRAFYCEEK